MTRKEEVEEQNAAIRSVAAGLRALVDELHEAGVIDRVNVANRLNRLRGENGQPIPSIQALAQGIAEGAFASKTTRDTLGVIDGGKDD